MNRRDRLQFSIARIGSGLALGLLCTTLANAQVTIDFSKLTCEQFYYSKLDTRSLSMWLGGFYNGKRNTTTVDVQKMKDSADKLARFCRQNANLKVPVMDAVERVMGGAQ